MHNIMPSPVGEGADRSEADEVLALVCRISPSGINKAHYESEPYDEMNPEGFVK